MMSRATLWADAERETGTNWSPTPEVICGVANGNPVSSNGTSRKNMFGMQQCNLFSAPRNNKAANLEEGFPSTFQFASHGEPMEAKIYAFRKGKADTYRKNEAIVFKINVK